jgi:uncharacterized protein (TIGR00369 family)
VTDTEGGGADDRPDAAEATRSSDLVGSATDGGASGHADTADLPGSEELERELQEHGLFHWLDLDIVTVEPGRAVFDLPFDEKFANVSSGTVHGGITATVIDTASGFALRSTFEAPARAALTTTDLNVRYVRPARGDLRVSAEVVRAGSSMGVTECEVTTVHEGEASDASRSSSDERSESDGGERKVVATGGTTYRLFRDGGADGTDGGADGADTDAAADED